MGDIEQSSARFQAEVPATTLGQVGIRILSTAFALAGCISFMRDSPLVDPPSTLLMIWAFLIGGVLGFLFVFLETKPLNPHAYFAVPVVFGLLALPNLTSAVEVYAFDGVRPHTAQKLAYVDGKYGLGGRGKSCAGVWVQAYAGARSIPIVTNTSICHDVDDMFRAHSPVCFLIDVETGRSGIKRASAPADEDRRRRCPV
uniref:hypothetical protein n=1 Tax=uncultured Sphingomonas sp. TaxID=158754 RepID=UPI0035C9CAD5